MDKFKVLIFFLLVAMGTQGVFAEPSKASAVGKGVTAVHGEHFEIGLQAGMGFHYGMQMPAIGIVRTYQNAIEALAEDFPAMEAFGGVVRYSMDYRWAFQLQAMRQRMYFKDNGRHFYNAMWDVDLTAEYNILNYGTRYHRPEGSQWLRARRYIVTPYVLFGVGVAMSNKLVPIRGAASKDEYGNVKWGEEDFKKMYPMINPADMGASFYLPVGVGVKCRVAYNWQLKLAFQYNLGIGKDPSGGTGSEVGSGENKKIVPITSYDNLNIGVWNNMMLNLGVVYSFGERKRMLADY